MVWRWDVRGILKCTSHAMEKNHSRRCSVSGGYAREWRAEREPIRFPKPLWSFERGTPKIVIVLNRAGMCSRSAHSCRIVDMRRMPDGLIEGIGPLYVGVARARRAVYASASVRRRTKPGDRQATCPPCLMSIPMSDSGARWLGSASFMRFAEGFPWPQTFATVFLWTPSPRRSGSPSRARSCSLRVQPAPGFPQRLRSSHHSGRSRRSHPSPHLRFPQPALHSRRLSHFPRRRLPHKARPLDRCLPCCPAQSKADRRHRPTRHATSRPPQE